MSSDGSGKVKAADRIQEILFSAGLETASASRLASSQNVIYKLPLRGPKTMSNDLARNGIFRKMIQLLRNHATEATL